MLPPLIIFLLLIALAVFCAWLARNVTLMRLTNLNDRGMQALSQRQYDAARAIYSELLRQTGAHRRGADLAVVTLTFLAAIHDAKSQPADAAALYERAASARASRATPYDAAVATVLARLANACAAAGQIDAAESIADRALEIAGQSPEANEGTLIDCLLTRSGLHANRQQFAAAEPLLRRASGIAENALDPGDPRITDARVRLAEALWRQSRHAEAATAYESTVADLEKVVELQGIVPDLLPALYQSLGRVAAEAGDPARASSAAARAADLCRMTGTPPPGAADEVVPDAYNSAK